MRENKCSKYSEIFNNLYMGIISYDKNSKIVFSNSYMQRLSGYSAAECKGFVLFDLFKDIDDGSENIFSQIVNESNQALKVILTTKGDKKINCNLHLMGHDSDCSIVYIKEVPNIESNDDESDITLKDRLEFERNKFWQYLSLVGSMIVTLDIYGKVAYINKKGCEILGYPEDWIIGKDWVKNFIPKESINEIDTIRESILTLKHNQHDYREGYIKNKNGDLRCIYWSNTVLYDENNEIIGTLSSGDDITENKIKEKTLYESEMRLKDSERMSKTGHWVRDIESNTYIFSDEMYRIFGLSKRIKLISDDQFRERIHPEDVKRIIDYSEKCIAKGKDYKFSGRLLLANNKIKHIKALVKIIKDKNGKPVSAKGIMTDVTETVLFEQELVESRNKLIENSNMLRKAEEIANIGHWVRVYEDNSSYWSDAIYRILGKEPQSFLASEREYENYIHPDDLATFAEDSKKAKNGEIPYDIYTRVISKDDKVKHIRIVGEREFKKNKLVRTFGTLQDITSIVETEAELLKKNTVLNNAEAIAHIGHWERDFNKGTLFFSDEIFRLVGYEPGSFDVAPKIEKQFLDHDDWERLNEAHIKTIEKRTPFDIDVKAKKRDGQDIVLKIKGGITSSEGKPLVMAGTIEDVTELKRHYEEIEYMNYHDPLTGLFNRRYFDEKFSEIDNKDYYPISIIITDVNGLKMINDTLGHDIGDDVLKLTADILGNACDDTDIVSRIGGDDFAILLPRTIKSQAELVIKDIYELFEEQSENLDISVSMGLAIKFDSYVTKEEIIKEAEDNMYTSKLYTKSSKRGDMLQLIMDALYERSNREEMHSERVSQYCKQMAKVLRLPVHKVNELTALGLLHDIGKIAVKDSVLNKPGRLNDEEWEEIKKHPEKGFRILNNAPGMSEASNYILAHHERWDGKGYPKGLVAYDIPLQARIIAIADAFDAMRSKRPYKDPLPLEVAINEIKNGAGTQFDPKLAKVFIMEVLKSEW